MPEEATELVSSAFAEFCAAGLWPGVGSKVLAELNTGGIRHAHQVSLTALAAVPGVNDKRANRLYNSWIGVGHLWELVQILVPLDLPARWANRLTDVLGDSVTAALQLDPWRLLLLPEASVQQADRLARTLDPTAGPDDPRRGTALVEWTLARFAKDGHTAAPVGLVADSLRAYRVDIAAAVRAGVIAERLATVPDPASAADPSVVAETWVARKALWDAESAIADRLIGATGKQQHLASTKALKAAAKGLDAIQAGAVAHAAGHAVSILTGGPGTGKSRTVSSIVAMCKSEGIDLALAAPTGRAAKRLEELAGYPATTIHRLLGARPGLPDFDYDAEHRLEVDLLVVDEASMLDVELAAALVAALPDDCHLVVVGDPAQLPSIGPGRFLGDLLDAGVFPVTELTTLYRQDEGGAIAQLATAVRGGELPAVTGADHEVVVVPADSGVDAARRVAQLVTDSIPRVFGISGTDLQVVTPVHAGPAGTKALNRALKNHLNPGPGTLRGFDIGDRVVATANHLDAVPSGYANGEVGTVVAAADKSLTVTFTGGDAEVSGKALGELLHGWAITVHRAQGSEWEAVIVVLPAEARSMLSRPLIYTALTRAKRHLSIVHAAGPAVVRAVAQIGLRPRRTLLVSLLGAGGHQVHTGDPTTWRGGDVDKEPNDAGH